LLPAAICYPWFCWQPCSATPYHPGKSEMTVKNSPTSTLDEVKDVIAQTLGIHDRVGMLSVDSQLFGSIPELDSFGVLELAAALEARFGFEIDDSAFTADIFETVGTLAEFVERNQVQRVRESIGR
jgi:acyl carrier protein